MGTPFYQIDGEVKFGPMEDGYKKYLSTLAKWYADGLIYKDFYTYVDSNTNPPDDLVLNDQMGLYGLNTQDIPNRYSEVVGSNPDIVVVGAYDPVNTRVTRCISARTAVLPLPAATVSLPTVRIPFWLPVGQTISTARKDSCCPTTV